MSNMIMIMINIYFIVCTKIVLLCNRRIQEPLYDDVNVNIFWY